MLIFAGSEDVDVGLNAGVTDACRIHIPDADVMFHGCHACMCYMIKGENDEKEKNRVRDSMYGLFAM